MIRNLIRFILLIFVVALVRWVIAYLARGFSSLMKSSEQPAGGGRSAGELKKDPVCGTFIPAATSIKKTVRGEVVHFCSAACRDKYHAA